MSTEPKPLLDPDERSEDFAGNLSITSLYTAGVWEWANIDGAVYLTTDDARRVFKVTNAALAIMRLFRWGLPKLPEGLAQRHILIDQLAAEYRAQVVLELAAGLSMRGWRTVLQTTESDLPIRYIEIDLPHVIAYKKDRLGHLVPLQKLELIGQDLKNLSIQRVDSLIGEDQKPLVIAEGLMMYLSPDESEALFRAIIPSLKRGRGRLIFDWVPTIEQPKPGLLGRCLGYLMKLFTGGDSFQRDERSRQVMSDLLYEYGASLVNIIDTEAIATERSLPFADQHTQQLIFCVDF